MGNYSKGISERIRHVRIKEGYCLICGSYGELTMDHVPPKGAITVSKIEQKHIFEILGADNIKLKGIKSHNGSRFKTICAKCNNEIIGKDDQEVSSVIKELNTKIKKHFSGFHSINNSVSVRFDPIRFCRAMIGHILSATTVNDCITEPVNSPYFSPLQDFVLGNDNALNDTHDIYYWFYPNRMHFSGKIIGFYNDGNFCLISILSFFPIAFLLTEKNKGIYPAQATKLAFNDSHIIMDLSLQNIKYANFPFISLEGNKMYMGNDATCIVSYPIK